MYIHECVVKIYLDLDGAVVILMNSRLEQIFLPEFG